MCVEDSTVGSENGSLDCTTGTIFPIEPMNVLTNNIFLEKVQEECSRNLEIAEY